MLVSIVIPCYNEEDNIVPLYERLRKVLKYYKYELIFVNDGSVDFTKERIQYIKSNDFNIKLINHEENLGHEAANYTGIYYCKGDSAIIIDADLQDPPELIPDFIDKWNEGYKLVYGIRTNRKYEKLPKAILGYIYYFLLKILTYSKLPFNVGDYCLIDKMVVEQIKLSKVKRELFRSHVHSFGVRSIGIKFHRCKRTIGESSYSLFDLSILGIKIIMANIRISAILIFILAVLGLIFIL